MMSLFEKIVYILQAEMTTPVSYGGFHFGAVLIVIALTTLLVWRFRDADERTVRRILLIAWLAMVISEIYKQTVFAMDSDGVSATWDYAWYAFPFQLCSTPLYVLPFAVFLKEGRVRDAFLAYMSTFSLFGGIAVLCYPGDVFISMIGINIQTMLHHGLQAVLGIFLAVHNRRRLCFRYYAKSIFVFTALTLTAMLLNIGVHHALLAGGHSDVFNMFYISPYFDCTLPIVSSIYAAVPYPVFLMLYIIGFALVAALVFFAAKGIITLTQRGCHAKK
jgi:hypothetical protein